MEWPEALDEAEGVLVAAQGAVVDGRLFAPSAIEWEALGPLPPELEARARSVLDRTRDMERRVLETIEELSRSNRVRQADAQDLRPASVLFDARG